MARIWLGENWSGRITIKENHELIQTGPYAITRNPIYSGFLLAFAGCSMSLGLLKGYLGIFFLISLHPDQGFKRRSLYAGGFWRKI